MIDMGFDSEPVGLKLQRVGEKTERESHYLSGFTQVISEYGLNRDMFRNPIHEVISGSIRLLDGYDVSEKLFSIPERGLMILGIVDDWMSTVSIKEKKSLIDVLKLVATGIIEDGEYGSYSGKVGLLSAHRNERGSEFDPQYDGGDDTSSEFISKLLQYIDDHRDEELTEEFRDVLSDWTEKHSKLWHVREKLGITLENEKEFDVVVLDVSGWSMSQDLGYTSLFYKNNGKTTLVMESNFLNSLEHEYVHSQSRYGGIGLSIWYKVMLFRGLNEAVTENSKLDPNTYPDQRRVLQGLFSDGVSEEVVYKAYVGDEDSRDELFRIFLDKYGMKGLMRIARMAPIDNPIAHGRMGESIFISPEEVYEELGLGK